jgi:hypothetical protein
MIKITTIIEFCALKKIIIIEHRVNINIDFLNKESDKNECIDDFMLMCLVVILTLNQKSHNKSLITTNLFGIF